jgi:PAS domain S-box-containing protein
MSDEDLTQEALLAEINALRARVIELEGAAAELARLKNRGAPPLSMAQEYCRVLLEHLPDGVVACNSEGTLVLFNQTSREWHGMDALKLPPEEWSSRYDLFGPDGATPLPVEQIPLLRAFRGERVRDAEMVIAAKGQAPRFILAAADPILDGSGLPVGAVAVMRDATAQRSAEEARSASEKELKALFQAITDIIIVVDREGRCLKIAPTKPDRNTKLAKVQIGQRLQDALPDADEAAFLAKIREAIDERKIVTIEHSEIGVGAYIWSQSTLSPLDDGTVFIVSRDITERKQAEQALRDNIRQEELIRAQSLALAELSTPLIPINRDVVVMPLVGVLDSQRMQQVMATLLTGISERRSRAAILDVTGVSVVDTNVANGLLRAARAAELLGSKVVLTGIRPDVAQSLIRVGLSLDGIVTRGTLESGIAYAMSADAQP